jgi:Trk K+ transport system NAD-binding subunit
MVTMLVRPDVADFLDEVAHAGGMELLLEQVAIQAGSALDGCTLSNARSRTGLDVTVLACRAPGTSANIRPGPDTVLAAGMQALALGTRDELKRFLQLAGSARQPGR